MFRSLPRLLPCLLILAAGASASQAQSIDPSTYYRLSTAFRGTDLVLDVFNGGPKNDLTRLDRQQNVTGQRWRFTPNGDGTYRLTTEFRGPGMCLDIINGGANDNQPRLVPCGNFSGQKWVIQKDGNWVKFTTKFRGPGMCLDIFNGGANDNQPHLGACGNKSGQQWMLSPVKSPTTAPAGKPSVKIDDNQ